MVIRNIDPSVQKLDVLRGESQLALDLSLAQAQGMTGAARVGGTALARSLVRRIDRQADARSP